MNNENNNIENEVVDSIPKDAKPIDGNNNAADNNTANNNKSQNTTNTYTTRIIIENSSQIPLIIKVGFFASLLSIVFCCFPTWAFIFALLGAGISVYSIASNFSGKGVATVALFISIIGFVLASFSGVLWLIWNTLISLFF